MKIISVIFVTLFICGCATVKNERPHSPVPPPVARVQNLYAGNPQLAGISIAQSSDELGSYEKYLGKHPALVCYVFWDGRVQQYNYEPDGKLMEKPFWWPRKLEVGNGSWKEVDFSYGSDPTFEKHQDPRKAAVFQGN